MWNLLLFTILLPESLLKIIQRFLRLIEIRGSFINSLCRVDQTIVTVNRLFSHHRNVTRVDLRGADAQWKRRIQSVQKLQRTKLRVIFQPRNIWRSSIKWSSRMWDEFSAFDNAHDVREKRCKQTLPLGGNVTYCVNILRLTLTLGYSLNGNNFLNMGSNDLSFFEKLQLVDWMTLKEVFERSRLVQAGKKWRRSLFTSILSDSVMKILTIRSVDLCLLYTG